MLASHNSEVIDQNRRRIPGTAAMVIAEQSVCFMRPWLSQKRIPGSALPHRIPGRAAPRSPTTHQRHKMA